MDIYFFQDRVTKLPIYNLNSTLNLIALKVMLCSCHIPTKIAMKRALRTKSFSLNALAFLDESSNVLVYFLTL